VFATQSRARETISLRTIEQIKPIEFELQYCSTGSYALSSGTGYTLTTSGAGTGYNWNSSQNTFVGYSAGTGMLFSNTISTNNMIEFSNTKNEPVLVITNDGDVEWHGKPSEAADALVRTFQFTVEDMKGVTKAARRRYYLQACQNILNKAETMPHDEFVAFLQKQVYNKERRVIMDGLKGEE
jgi:hypothetical protein